MEVHKRSTLQHLHQSRTRNCRAIGQAIAGEEAELALLENEGGGAYPQQHTNRERGPLIICIIIQKAVQRPDHSPIPPDRVAEQAVKLESSPELETKIVQVESKGV